MSKGASKHPYFDTPQPVVIGHRGAAGHAPENTLASFAIALDHGAAILESDVHLTRDGVAVLCHDPDVARTTEGSGAVAELPFAELQALDAGFRFQPLAVESAQAHDEFPERARGHRIPSLAEAFEAFPAARFNLELKARSTALAAAVADLVAERDDALTLLTAEQDEITRGIRSELERRGARPALGADLAEVLRFIASAQADEAPDIEANALQVPAVFGGEALVGERFVEHAHAHGVAVHVWTINDEAEMDRLLDLGVDGLVTDLPDRLVARLAARAAASSKPSHG